MLVVLGALVLGRGTRSLRKAASRTIVPGTMSLPAIDDFSGSINPVSSDACGKVDGGRGIELDIRVLELGLAGKRVAPARS